MKNEEGEWTGISIDLWRDLATDIGIEYRFQEFSLKWMMTAIEQAKVDVAIAAITMTPDREAVFDFSYPYFYSGLGIAVSRSNQVSATKQLLAHVFSLHSIRYLAGLIVSFTGLCLMTFLLNFSFESRGRFATMKSPTHIRQLDKQAQDLQGTVLWLLKNKFGRIIAATWMLISVGLISHYQPELTAISASIEGPSDLSKVRVGTVSHSSSETYLKKRQISPPMTYEDVPAGLRAIEQNEIAAFVFDRPALIFHVDKNFSDKISVLDLHFEPQGYGIALPAGSPLREELNRALLKRLSNDDYLNRLKSKYMSQ